MARPIKEYPDCDAYFPFGGLQAYAMNVRANICKGNEPYSCRRAREEGLCTIHPIRKKGGE